MFDFFGLLRHFEGEWGSGDGQPVILEPWEKFILGCIFGWKLADGTRRFREAWIRLARKQGKSLLAGGVGLCMLVIDGEAGAQIYVAATKRAQARIIHRAAVAMRDKSPSLRGVITVRRDRLIYAPTRSFFEPLGKDKKTEDGLNPHCILVDEVHAHADAGLWNVLESATGARTQALIFGITTAGYGANTFGRQKDDYYRKVVDPNARVANDNAFVYIAELDAKIDCGGCNGKGTREDGEKCEPCDGRGYTGDDPHDEAAWPKVMPNLGVSVKIDAFRRASQKALDDPTFEEEYLTKWCNLWLQVGKRWLSVDQWDACERRARLIAPDFGPADLKGCPCFGGLDLATTTDTCAFILYFPPWGKRTFPAVLSHFWVPADRIEERWKKDSVDYRQWVEQGFIEAVPGSSIDQTFVYAGIKRISAEYLLQMLAYDPRDAQMLTTLLEGDGFRLHRSGQGYAEYNAPTKELERIVFDGPLMHFGNPVERWMIGNVVLDRNIDGDVKPSKGKSAEKVDGAHALVMALGIAGTNPIVVAQPIEHHTLRRNDGRGGNRGGRGGAGGSGSRKILDAFKTR